MQDPEISQKRTRRPAECLVSDIVEITLNERGTEIERENWEKREKKQRERKRKINTNNNFITFYLFAPFLVAVAFKCLSIFAVCVCGWHFAVEYFAEKFSQQSFGIVQNNTYNKHYGITPNEQSSIWYGVARHLAQYKIVL